MEENVKKGRKILIVAIILIIAIAIILSIQHDVDVEIEGEGTVEPTHASVHLFGTAEFKMIPAEGYRISEVSVDGGSKEIDDGILKLTHILSDHKVRVVFSPAGTYRLDISTEGSGSVSYDSGEYAEGETIVLDITPGDGNVISDVIVDGESIGSTNRVPIMMDSGHTVEVKFRECIMSDPIVDVSVNVKVGSTTGADYGTISPSGLVRVAYGGSLAVTIALNEGYVLSSVVVDGKEVGTSPIVMVTDITEDVDIDITVLSTAVKTYTITSSFTSGGSISPSGSVSVIGGGSQTFTITAYSGYHLSSLVIDGTSISYSGRTYTFSNITSDHSISAVFAADPAPGPTPSSPKTLQSMTVQSHPTVVEVGTELDVSQISVKLNYSDGSSKVVTSGFTCSQTRWDSVGQKTVTVSYQGKTGSFSVTVLDENGFEATVTHYEGYKAGTFGDLEYFEEDVSERLSGFTFDLSGIIPGVTQTITVDISNTSGITLDAFVMLTEIDDGGLADYITLTVNGNTMTISEILDAQTSGEWSTPLGEMSSGSRITVDMTIALPQETGNEAMGKSLSFKLGVFAAQQP